MKTKLIRFIVGFNFRVDLHGIRMTVGHLISPYVKYKKYNIKKYKKYKNVVIYSIFNF